MSKPDPRKQDMNELADEVFRSALRNWLEEYLPPEYRQDHRRPFLRLRHEDHIRWLRLQHEHGWRAPGWPREWGGMGLSFRKQIIYLEEFERAGAARVIDNAVTMLGPVLIHYGNEAQKRKYLPPILSCEHIWAQGYSEPGSGSDLASLRTRAERDGDHFVVNGQKIWTSHATDCTHIFALVRTGRYEKKQQGISFLMIDLKSPGITIRPIITLAGEDELCEVFFDDVRVPVANLVGEVDKGWTIAKELLGHERVFLGSPALAGRGMALAEKLVEELQLEEDQGVLDRLATIKADLHDFRLVLAEICEQIAAGGAIGPEVSVLKIYVTELMHRITEFNASIAGEYAGIVGDEKIGGTVTDIHWQFMMSRPGSIFGGTNEIQRDILARSLLGMK